MSALQWWTRWIGRRPTGLVPVGSDSAAPNVQLVHPPAPESGDCTGRPLDLGEHDLLRVRHARGLEIRALRGHLWVTQDGDPRDVVLGPGQAYRPDRDARVLVAPLGPAQVLVATGASR